jgi:predicted transcriptional regulator
MMQSERVHHVKLDQHGLARVFGDLEAAVMGAVWALDEPTVGAVCTYLGAGANYKTVTTVMNRLVAKQVLGRRRVGRVFIYAAVDSREAFMESVSRRLFEGLVQDFGAAALAPFVDAVDAVDPALLDSLERLVRERGTGSGVA